MLRRSPGFVGRKSEISRIEAALGRRQNVVLHGKYGIGRTALVREVARRNDRWRVVFTDFGRPASVICTSILAQLSGASRSAIAGTNTARQLTRAVVSWSGPKRVTRLVIVLDNVAKLTRPKVDLLRRLHESERLVLIAILESFVDGDALMRIRVALDPAIVVSLSALDLDTSMRFFGDAAARFDLPWSPTDIEMLAKAVHGYPLEMVRTVNAARRRREALRP